MTLPAPALVLMDDAGEDADHCAFADNFEGIRAEVLVDGAIGVLQELGSAGATGSGPMSASLEADRERLKARCKSFVAQRLVAHNRRRL